MELDLIGAGTLVVAVVGPVVAFLIGSARSDEKLKALAITVARMEGLDPNLGDRVNDLSVRVAKFSVYVDRILPIENKLDEIQTSLNRLEGRFDMHKEAKA